MSRYVVIFHPGVTVPDRMKYVDDATGPPDVNDDAATLGVTVGSLWIDTSAPAVYACADASTGAAVWVPLGGGTGSGDLASLLTDLTVSGAHTVDRDDAATHDLTLTGNATLTPDHTNPPAGEAIDLRIVIRQDGTGGWTLGWGGTITWAGGSEPAMPSGADETLTVGLLSLDDGATWLGFAGGGGADDQTAAEVPFTPAGTIAATDTQGAVEEVATDAAAALATHAATSHGGIGPILITSEPAGSPLVFADLLQNSEGTDLLYASEP